MAGTVRVAVTGAAGQVAYAMLGRLASGEVFGHDTQVILHLLEITPALPALEGVAMELDDCSFSTLKDIVITDNAEKAFDGCNYALLVGSFPRKAGMERKELLDINGKIFVGQGKALAAKAASDVRILVVGNPCNTNCLVARSNGRSIPADRWTAMTRLDHNRARTALAKKAGVSNSDVTQMTIWGNHSNTQFPDLSHAMIGNDPVSSLINDAGWVEHHFIPTVQKRGAAIIEARRGKSSAASAANAIINHMQDWIFGTREGDWVSMGVPSNGSYGIPSGVIYSFPVTCQNGRYQIVNGLEISHSDQEKMQASYRELAAEQEAIRHLFV